MQEVLLRFVPFARGSILIDRDFRTITKLHPLTDAVGFNVIRTVASFDGVHLTLEKTAVRELGKGLTLNVRPRNVDPVGLPHAKMSWKFSPAPESRINIDIGPTLIRC